MDATLKLDLLRAKSAIGTVAEWQRLGLVFAVKTACDNPSAAWAALRKAGRYPNGTTKYEVHRKMMAWFDAALTPEA